MPDLTSTKFYMLKSAWKHDTLVTSSATVITSHPAYQAIIALGKPVLPYIFKDLERAPDHWFTALIAITGEDPAVGEDTMTGATQKWLAWARVHEYL